MLDEISGSQIDLFLLGGNHEKRYLTSYNKISRCCEVKKAIALCYNSAFCRKLPIGMTKQVMKSQADVFFIIGQRIIV